MREYLVLEFVKEKCKKRERTIVDSYSNSQYGWREGCCEISGPELEEEQLKTTNGIF
jgi:hypothetical protein